MIRRPPISTRTDTLFPYTTLFRSQYRSARRQEGQAQGRSGQEELNYFLPPLQGRAVRLASLLASRSGWESAASRGRDRRSEERRVGEEWVSACRTRWSPVQETKKRGLIQPSITHPHQAGTSHQPRA